MARNKITKGSFFDIDASIIEKKKKKKINLLDSAESNISCVDEFEDFNKIFINQYDTILRERVKDNIEKKELTKEIAKTREINISDEINYNIKPLESIKPILPVSEQIETDFILKSDKIEEDLDTKIQELKLISKEINDDINKFRNSRTALNIIAQERETLVRLMTSEIDIYKIKISLNKEKANMRMAIKKFKKTSEEEGKEGLEQFDSVKALKSIKHDRKLIMHLNNGDD
jgi:hypothetical protein